MKIHIQINHLLRWLDENRDWGTQAKASTLASASGYTGKGLTERGVRKMLDRRDGRDWIVDDKYFGDFCALFEVPHGERAAMISLWSGRDLAPSYPDHRVYDLPYTTLKLLVADPLPQADRQDTRFRRGKLHIGLGENRLSPIDGTPFIKRAVFVEQVSLEVSSERKGGGPFDRPRNYVRHSYSGSTLSDQTAPGAVTIIVLRHTAEVVLTIEVRPIIRSCCAEAARGFPELSDQRSGDNAARREAWEETGIEPILISPPGEDRRFAYRSLATIYPDSGALSDKVKLALMIGERLDEEAALSKLALNRWQLATVTVDGADFFAACLEPGRVIPVKRVVSLVPDMLRLEDGVCINDNFTISAANLARPALREFANIPGFGAIQSLTNTMT